MLRRKDGCVCEFMCQEVEMDSRECWGRRREGGIMDEHRREEYLGQAGQMLSLSRRGDSADYPASPELKATTRFYTHTQTHTLVLGTHVIFMKSLTCKLEEETSSTF